EFTGSMVYTTELASPRLRGLISSSTAAGTTLGFILGSLAAWAVNRALGHEAASAWGWRIPFIASVLFCVAGWLLRRGRHETAAAFTRPTRAKRPPQPALRSSLPSSPTFAPWCRRSGSSR